MSWMDRWMNMDWTDHGLDWTGTGLTMDRTDHRLDWTGLDWTLLGGRFPVEKASMMCCGLPWDCEGMFCFVPSAFPLVLLYNDMRSRMFVCCSTGRERERERGPRGR